MITIEEIKSKQSNIVKGLEFYIPNHQKTALIKVIVTNRALVDKTSCWGDYQKDMVFFEEVAQASKQTFVDKQRSDGSNYTDIVWVPCKDKFYTNTRYMSISSFIEYIFNKKVNQNNTSYPQFGEALV
tara:strand:- start:78 stop:461 length:384 start_codon:yes stop_codon:yes gene_type:complete